MAPGVLVSEVGVTVDDNKIPPEKPYDPSVPRRYDLPTNSLKSFWQTSPHRLHDFRSNDDLPKHSDIVIIGAGYAGTSVAYHLSQDPLVANKSITILEARGACSGATGRNGGHLRPDFYSHIDDYCDRAGVEAAVEVAEFEISHVWAIKKLVEEEEIDCDFTLTRSYDVWCNEAAAEVAKARYERMKARGLRHMDDVVWYDRKNAEGVSAPP